MQTAADLTTPYLVRIARLGGSPVLADADQINVGVDYGSQQCVLGVLENLIPQLGRVPELAGGHGDCLDEEHLIQVLVSGVDLAAVGDLFALHGIDEGQHVCAVAPHAFEDLSNVGGGQVPGAPTGSAADIPKYQRVVD